MCRDLILGSDLRELGMFRSGDRKQYSQKLQTPSKSVKEESRLVVPQIWAGRVGDEANGYRFPIWDNKNVLK